MRHFPCTSFPLLQNEFIKHCLNVALYYRAHDVSLEEPSPVHVSQDRGVAAHTHTYFNRFDSTRLHSDV